jgi:signal transduction histidine kinase
MNEADVRATVASLRRANRGWIFSAVVGGLSVVGAALLAALVTGAIPAPAPRPRVTIGLALLVTALLVLAVDRLARAWFIRPVEDVRRTLVRVRGGDLKARARRQGVDEAGDVADELNALIDEVARVQSGVREELARAVAAVESRNDELVQSYQRMFALREQLARAQQTAAAGQTAANLAHQIGTPLNLISGYVQMMMEDPGLDARSLERLHSIEEQIRKVTGFIRTTLDAVRRSPRAPEPVFPAAVLRRLSEIARPRAVAAGIELRLDVPEDLPWLMGDSVQLELALLNLVNNSLEAMPGGGRVRIYASREGSSTRIEVADDGPGIPEGILPRVFEPWVTSKPSDRGTGLGLSITRDVVKEHGGSIEVHSAPAQGTSFVIVLPGHAAAPAVREV